MSTNRSYNHFQPFVSVIVPVHNGSEFVAKNIESLLNQNYPQDRYEILVVDNLSTDDTREIVSQYNLVCLEERDRKNSYLARNLGLKYSRGEFVAFVDIDCILNSNFISSGVKKLLENQDIDIIAGKIEFLFTGRESPAQLTDSFINLNNEHYVKYRHAAHTANIFTRRKVFDDIGLFSTAQSSGGDIEWTNRAWRMGKKLVYDSDVFVYHPARGLRELLKKHFRTGTGSLAVWKNNGRGAVWVVVRFISLLTPLLSLRLFFLVKKYGDPDKSYPWLTMFLVAYLCSLVGACGIVYTFFGNLMRKT